jgi:hypothetical protein
MNPVIPDICFELKKVNGRYQGKIHFNKIKASQTLHPTNDFNQFLEDIAFQANSTFDKVSSLPGRSSAEVARFSPDDTIIENSEENPLTDEEIQKIKEHILQIEANWFDEKNPGL